MGPQVLPRELVVETLALINQSCVEPCAGLRTGVMVRKDAHVIHENSVNGQSQCMTQQVLINAVVETSYHEHVLPLNSHISEAAVMFQSLLKSSVER